MFIYSDRSSKDQGERSNFVNYIMDMIYKKHNGDLQASLPDIKIAWKHCENNIRNVYELSDSEIPMVGYYELVTLGADNFGFSPEEYNEALESCKNACVQYHSHVIE